ncbi:MAG: YraN family protein [Varibaculum cambriense]|nr:YraN family protein [Varibaculum cambriense]
MFELKQKAIKAAATFLDRRGYEVIDTEWESEDGGYIDVVARDEDAIVFCDVQARRGVEKGMPEESLGVRERMEINAAKWLGEHGDDPDNVDVTIRFDSIAMLVIGEDRVCAPKAPHQLPGIRNDRRHDRVAIRWQRRGRLEHRARGGFPERSREE